MTSVSALRAPGWRPLRVGTAGVLLLVVASGCVRAGDDAGDEQRGPGGAVETCDSDVRNQEWDIDCSAACQHVASCRVTYEDSDLTELTCSDCLGSCVAGVALGGNDVAESTEEDRRSWECAVMVEGCGALDHNCDLY